MTKKVTKKKAAKKVAKKPVERKLKDVPAAEWLDRLYGITRDVQGQGAEFHELNAYGYKKIKDALKKK